MISHYRILRKIGGGGMAAVDKTQDAKRTGGRQAEKG
jgi:hypothetical protein